MGTSLPEFVTAIVSIVKRQGSLSLGNIIGANVIDTTLIIPLCGFLSGRPLAISRQCLSLDLPFCLLIASLAVLPMLIKGKLMRWQGACMMGVYGVYVTLLVT